MTALIMLSPLFVVIPVAIKLSDRGPVFFRQTRVGKNGNTFRVWKFRTMVVDAEQRKADLAALNEGAGALFKMRRDPRVTRVGVWLRRYSLDELPQLFNVLVGSMSLVGPRPALPAETARYGDHMRRRLAVKPGITGLWQINGRSDLPWDEAVRLDLRYVENWSFALDLQILWKTWSAVFRGSGAY
jgi:exopolysaccharide biosynthesis polyprenyl glycosylphosphotransferase